MTLVPLAYVLSAMTLFAVANKYCSLTPIHPPLAQDTLHAHAPHIAVENSLWHFYKTDSVAAGPETGGVVFNNQCVFAGVSPSIAISDTGDFAALLKPIDQHNMQLMLVNFTEKKAYIAHSHTYFWGLYHIKNHCIYGHLYNRTLTAPVLPIKEVLLHADELPLVNDDGWWLIDSPNRKPLPRYNTLVVNSPQQLHRALFVPDLKPFKRNPLDRKNPPCYIVLIDDEQIDIPLPPHTVPQAQWLNGSTDEPDRYLVINDSMVIDFYGNGHFDAHAFQQLTLNSEQIAALKRASTAQEKP